MPVALVAELADVVLVAVVLAVTTDEPVEVEVGFAVLILSGVFEFAVFDDKLDEFAVVEETAVLLFPFVEEEFVDCVVSVRPGEDILNLVCVR